MGLFRFGRQAVQKPSQTRSKIASIEFEGKN